VEQRVLTHRIPRADVQVRNEQHARVSRCDPGVRRIWFQKNVVRECCGERMCNAVACLPRVYCERLSTLVYVARTHDPPSKNLVRVFRCFSLASYHWRDLYPLAT
jgi:hypothetical protein